MSKFITGKELENIVYDIIRKASNTLLIVSPYINPDTYFRKLFENHFPTKLTSNGHSGTTPITGKIIVIDLVNLQMAKHLRIIRY